MLTCFKGKQLLSLRGRRVLVTGASGHLGAHLVSALVKLGSKVLALTGPRSDTSRLETIRNSIVIIPVDIRDVLWHRHKQFSGGVDVVFHLAAAGINPKQRLAELMIDTNISGTFNALEAAREWKVKRFVYCGSSSEYCSGIGLKEDERIAPVSEYGVTKASGGLLANVFFQRYGVPVVSVRPFMLYGPMEAPFRVVSHVIGLALKGQDIELSDGMQVRDWVYVDDAAEAFVLASAVLGVEGEVFNIASGQPHTVREVVEEILRLVGGPSRPRFGALPRRAEDVDVLVGNSEKTWRVLGWKAQTGLREGLEKTIQWYRQEDTGEKP